MDDDRNDIKADILRMISYGWQSAFVANLIYLRHNVRVSMREIDAMRGK